MGLCNSRYVSLISYGATRLPKQLPNFKRFFSGLGVGERVGWTPIPRVSERRVTRYERGISQVKRSAARLGPLRADVGRVDRRGAHASVGSHTHHFAFAVLGLGLDLTFRVLSFILRAATPPAVPTAEAPSRFATSALAHMGQGMSVECSRCVSVLLKSVESAPRKSRSLPRRSDRASDRGPFFAHHPQRSCFHRGLKAFPNRAPIESS